VLMQATAVLFLINVVHIMCGSVKRNMSFFFDIVLYISHLYRTVSSILIYHIYVLNHLPSASRLRRGGLLALGAGE